MGSTAGVGGWGGRAGSAWGQAAAGRRGVPAMHARTGNRIRRIAWLSAGRGRRGAQPHSATSGSTRVRVALSIRTISVPMSTGERRRSLVGCGTSTSRTPATSVFVNNVVANDVQSAVATTITQGMYAAYATFQSRASENAKKLTTQIHVVA